MASRVLLGLDIGTSTIKAVVAENKGGKPALRMIFKMPSAGLRKGALVDLADTSQMIGRVFAEIRKHWRGALKNTYVTVGTTQVKAQPSRGIVAVSRTDNEIYQDDVERAIRASQAINLASNRMILHNVTREFIIDGVGDVIDPLGLSGNRLEVSSLIIDVFAPHVKSLIRAIELAGGEVGGMFLNPLVAGRSVLSKAQKDLGVALVDIGYGTTGLSVYEENKLVGVARFPVGAANISNDLAVALKIPVNAAESLKLHYGHAVARDVSLKEVIELKKFHPESKGTISRRFVAEIIELRLAEIFEFINNELKLLGRAGQLAGGLVFVGGGAKLPGLTELGKQELKLSSQVGSPLNEEWIVETGEFQELFGDPEFVTALGLILGGADQERWRPSSISSRFAIKDILRYFVP